MKFRSKLVHYYYENTPLVWLIITAYATAVLDFLDLGWFPKLIGKGWFTHNDIQALVSLFVGAPLVLTLFEAFQANQESQAQTELQLRPYLSVHWDSGPEENQREGQGIMSTCLKLRNDGLGLMRNAEYKITADGLPIDVRNHSVITPRSSTWVAYATNDSPDLLGNPSFQKDTPAGNAQKGFNDQIISEVKIVITGSYQDIVGNKYAFSIASDKREQSWFADQKPQRKTRD